MIFPYEVIEDFVTNEIKKFVQNNETLPPIKIEKNNEWKYLYYFYQLFLITL